MPPPVRSSGDSVSSDYPTSPDPDPPNGGPDSPEPSDPDDLTLLLRLAKDGDKEAAETAITAVYERLLICARAVLGSRSPSQTLKTQRMTTGSPKTQWNSSE